MPNGDVRERAAAVLCQAGWPDLAQLVHTALRCVVMVIVF